MLKVGQKAPDFSLPNQDNTLVNLNDFKGYFNDFKLKIISTYGDYNLNPFNKKSERLIMVIKKSQP